jgi:hypothetical protein
MHPSVSFQICVKDATLNETSKQLFATCHTINVTVKDNGLQKKECLNANCTRISQRLTHNDASHIQSLLPKYI